MLFRSTVHNAQCSVFNFQFPIFKFHFTIYNVQFIFCSILEKIDESRTDDSSDYESDMEGEQTGTDGAGSKTGETIDKETIRPFSKNEQRYAEEDVAVTNSPLMLSRNQNLL